MRNRNPILLGIAATATCYLLVERSQTNGIIANFYETLSASMFACWFAAFVVGIIGPPTCAVGFWLLAKRSRYGWMIHLALVPATFIIAIASDGLIHFAAGERAWSESMSSRASLQAFALMVICPIGYFVALLFGKIRKTRQVADVR